MAPLTTPRPSADGRALDRAIKRLKDAKKPCFLVGSQLDFRMGYGREPAWNREAQVVHVDLDPHVLGGTLLREREDRRQPNSQGAVSV